jgi:hypothetical protein
MHLYHWQSSAKCVVSLNSNRKFGTPLQLLACLLSISTNDRFSYFCFKIIYLPDGQVLPINLLVRTIKLVAPGVGQCYLSSPVGTNHPWVKEFQNCSNIKRHILGMPRRCLSVCLFSASQVFVHFWYMPWKYQYLKVKNLCTKTAYKNT